MFKGDSMIRVLSLMNGWFPYVAGLSLLLAATVWIYMRGYNACIAHQESVTIKQEKVLNEIRNRPHSVDITAQRLQRGTF
jgi:hypothetical protein